MTDVSKCQNPRPEDTEVTEDSEENTDHEREDAHLDGVEVGAGCTEIWEHLAEQRDE
ncbi:hypothetical protein OB955_17115 [Halobacteria archaeon AArc-m2/3/4]|uniref:Uncharacterized protein n=1 Tax=Natronoglomus mannanivorans TaxID=2979990 RepID=A0AAP3E4H1_9EURY|nr:hypothetical protein [Halobacteria archaeon AArc-xg1-1]MCU4974446.1 hypothetical protein [Halobacteria archaeon AArc-m2/3/4]